MSGANGLNGVCGLDINGNDELSELLKWQLGTNCIYKWHTRSLFWASSFGLLGAFFLILKILFFYFENGFLTLN